MHNKLGIGSFLFLITDYTLFTGSILISIQGPQKWNPREVNIQLEIYSIFAMTEFTIPKKMKKYFGRMKFYFTSEIGCPAARKTAICNKF